MLLSSCFVLQVISFYPRISIFFFFYSLIAVKNLETGRSSPGVKVFYSQEIVNGEALMSAEAWGHVHLVQSNFGHCWIPQLYNFLIKPVGISAV